MERVFKVKKRYIDKLPGIVHIDNTARVQTVNKKTNPDFYKFLKNLKKYRDFRFC